MRQPTLETLTRDECEAYLAGGSVGRIAVEADDRLHVLPVNYAVDGLTVVFRTGPETVLTEAALRTVAFEVDAFDEGRRTGWSVCVHGYGREITDCVDERSRQLQELPVDCWAPEGRDRWFEIIPESVTGRYLSSGHRLPPGAPRS